MRTIQLLLALALLPGASYGQGYGLLNLYQVGSTTFEDRPIGGRTITTNSVLLGGKFLEVDRFFFVWDASSIMRALLTGGAKADKGFRFTDDQGAQAMDLPTWSLRYGWMAGNIGFGLDADIRSLHLRCPVDSLSSGYYQFNTDAGFGDLNFGLVACGYFELGKVVSINPTIGWDMMLLEREATPVDGHLFFVECPVQLWLLGDFGVNVEPDLQIRRVKTTDTEDKYPQTMFALKLGFAYHLPD